MAIKGAKQKISGLIEILLHLSGGQGHGGVSTFYGGTDSPEKLGHVYVGKFFGARWYDVYSKEYDAGSI